MKSPSARRPVFLDSTGRRHRTIRRAGAVLAVPAVGYLVLMASSLLGGPRLGHPARPAARGRHSRPKHRPQITPAPRPFKRSPARRRHPAIRPAHRARAPTSTPATTTPSATPTVVPTTSHRRPRRPGRPPPRPVSRRPRTPATDRPHRLAGRSHRPSRESSGRATREAGPTADPLVVLTMLLVCLSSMLLLHGYTHHMFGTEPDGAVARRRPGRRRTADGRRRRSGDRRAARPTSARSVRPKRGPSR